MKIGVAGHAGIGHVNGVVGFVQDDSAGFSTVGSMIADLLNVETRIKKAEADVEKNIINITTMGGGSFSTSPRRGMTPAEARLINGLPSSDALFSQSVVVDCFGRMFGQGVWEPPLCLQAALANAVVDTFYKKASGEFAMAEESLESNSGLIGGITREFGDYSVSYLLTVNHTTGGLGPVEDLEGNIALGSKRIIMEKLDMLKCPTIIVESKAYMPAVSDELKENTFLVRAQNGVDNKAVARALYDSARELGYPVICRDDLLPSAEGVMKRSVVDLAGRITRYASELKTAESASERAGIVAKLTELVGQDAGAITCLSNKLHDVARGAGIIPGTCAVLSTLVSREDYEHWKIPIFGRDEAEKMKNIINLAVEKIASNYEEASRYVNERYVDIGYLEHIIE